MITDKQKQLINDAYMLGLERGKQSTNQNAYQKRAYTPTKDESEFPSFYLSQRNQRRENGGEGNYGAYNSLFGSGRNTGLKDRRNAYSILFGR